MRYGEDRGEALGRQGQLFVLGLTDYREACGLQKELHQARVENIIGDVLLVTEHLSAYTFGRMARAEHVGEGWERGVLDGIPVYAADRGGSVTYHGPGQLVGYPIVRMKDYCSGPKAYVALLEEVLIRALAALGLPSGRRLGLPGVWVEDRKIAAIGVRISRGVTRHGFAVNVANDLTPFSAVIPCGLAGCKVTSITKEGVAVGAGQPISAVVEAFQNVLGLSLVEARIERMPRLTACVAYAGGGGL